MRLIDADTVKEKMAETLKILKITFHEREQRAHLVSAFHTVSLIVDDGETIDAVPVVSCKDCVYYDHLDSGSVFCYLDGRGTKETDYCSWAERKDDNETERT